MTRITNSKSTNKHVRTEKWKVPGFLPVCVNQRTTASYYLCTHHWVRNINLYFSYWFLLLVANSFSGPSCHYLKHYLIHRKIWISRFFEGKKKKRRRRRRTGTWGPGFHKTPSTDYLELRGLSRGLTGFQRDVSSVCPETTLLLSLAVGCFNHVNMRPYPQHT